MFDKERKGRRVAPLGVKLLALVLALPVLGARAESMLPSLDGLGLDRWWMVGAQLTSINQVNTRVRGPYNPSLSFGQETSYGWSVTASLLGAVSPWENGALVVMPEYANGRGMPNASGLGAYPNGDIIRVPQLGKEPYLARLFFHQDIPLNGERAKEPVEFEGRFMPAGFHALRSGHATSRLEFTIGKFAANDFLDVSSVSGDTRHRFMSWALWEQAAWDYAADTRGYTWGAVVALETPRFAVRGAVATMPTTANGPDYDWSLRRHRSEMLEGELRYSVSGKPGAAKLLLYVNHAHMGNYQDALAAAGGQHDPRVCGPDGAGVPCITEVEKVGAIKYGVGLLVEQRLSDSLAGFFRAGANDGHTETFAFTEIDRSVSAGLDLAGAAWGRPDDHLAVGAAVSGLSSPHRAYLAAGGQGFQLGDGGLDYGVETVAEISYLFHVTKFLEVTADAQGLLNPGMNAARSPLGIFGLRLHAHY